MEAKQVRPGIHKPRPASSGGAWHGLLSGSHDPALLPLYCVILALLLVIVLAVGCAVSLYAGGAVPEAHRSRQGCCDQELRTEEGCGGGAVVRRGGIVESGVTQRRRQALEAASDEAAVLLGRGANDDGNE